MANYTLRAGGTAANKAAALDGDPAVQAECMSIATANSDTYSAGDNLYFADTGGVFRDGFVQPSAGSSAADITLTEYPGDSPEINGSDLVGDVWALHADDIWKTSATISTEPEQIWVDDVYGRRRDEVPTLLDSLSDAANNTLFDCNADFHVRTTFIHEATKAINIRVRWGDDDNCIQLAHGGSNSALRITEFDTGTPDHKVGLNDILEDGIEYTTDFVGEGTALTAYLKDANGDMIEQITTTSAFQQATAQGSLNESHTGTATCDIWSFSNAGGQLMVTDGDWFWSGDILYLYSTAGDPYANYSSPGVEAGAVANVISVSTGIDYITIDGLKVTKSNDTGIRFYQCDYSTARNCTVEWSWESGIQTKGGDSDGYGVLFEDNLARYNGEHGLNCTRNTGYAMHDYTVRRNTGYRNGRYQFNIVADWTQAHAGTSGMKLWVDSEICTNVQVYENWTYENGPSQSYDLESADGHGVWMDNVYGASGDRMKVFHNLTHDNHASGIYIEICKYNDVGNNITFDNGVQGNTPSIQSGCGIKVGSRIDFDLQYNRVFNNSIYGSVIGIQCRIYNETTGNVEYNEFKNNIISECPCAIYAGVGGSNDARGQGNKYIGNHVYLSGAKTNYFFAEDTFYDHASTALADWTAAMNALSTPAVAVSDNTESDPLYTDPSNGDLTLQVGSPCIDTGIQLPDAFKEGLGYESTWTTSVKTKNQNSHGEAWDKGAYVFHNPTTGTSTRIKVVGTFHGSIRGVISARCVRIEDE